jgi:hypothetical protein
LLAQGRRHAVDQQQRWQALDSGILSRLQVVLVRQQALPEMSQRTLCYYQRTNSRRAFKAVKAAAAISHCRGATQPLSGRQCEHLPGHTRCRQTTSAHTHRRASMQCCAAQQVTPAQPCSSASCRDNLVHSHPQTCTQPHNLKAAAVNNTSTTSAAVA